MGQRAPEPGSRAFPRVPGYAWSWLQRSRPVLLEVAERLTGGPPGAGFVDGLRRAFEIDVFTRDVVVAVVADVAFGGRIPRSRPPGASWDRGLTWWAAAIAGTTPEEFEARTALVGRQRPLFEAPAADAPAPAPPAPSPERAMLLAGLRGLLASADGDCVPVAAVRSLLDAIRSAPPSAGGRAPQ